MNAECQCGQLTVELPRTTPAVVVCHCIDCQRRSGSPFGVLAYYPGDQLTILGDAKRFERPTATGGVFETYFCSSCGSTVYAKTEKHPNLIGIAVGTIAEPHFQSPVRSVWEQSMHHWIKLPPEVEHFPKGRA